MAFADYYRRDAVAIAQVLRDFDEAAIKKVLRARVLEIALSAEVETRSEGDALADLMVRLAARLYPTLAFMATPDVATKLSELALSINPAIEIVDRPAPDETLTIGVGTKPQVSGSDVIYAGSSQWVGRVSWERPQSVGLSRSPFGAGAAAALAMAQAFNSLFLGKAARQPFIELPVVPGRPRPLDVMESDTTRVVIVGAGAVGNAAIWAWARMPYPPVAVVVDPEVIELSNLQRYVLAERSDVGVLKVDLARRFLPAASAVGADWASFVAQAGYRHDIVAVSVDSADGRRAVQATLPNWIINAWTQPGDLGVSHHRFDGTGACLACLYLPQGQTKNEDAIYAEALGIPEQLMQVRALLDRGDPVPDPLLELVGQRLGVEREAIMAFAGRPIRALYAEGLCGGALLPIGSAGRPRPEVHVPLAHQSTLAGVMLAARVFVAPAVKDRTLVARVNVLGQINAEYVTQMVARDSRGICICEDRDYQAAYSCKYRQQPHSEANNDH